MTDGDGVLKIAKEGGITFIGNIIGRILGFAFIAVVTRLVSPGVYGTYTLALSIVMFARGFADLNLHRALDYFIPQYLQNDEGGKARATLRSVFGIAILTTAGAAVLVAFAAPLFGDLFNDLGLVVAVPVLALAIPLATVTKIFQSSFKAIKVLKYRAYIKDIIRPSARLIGTVILLLTGAEILGLIVGHLLGLAVAGVAGAIFLYREAEWVSVGSQSRISRRSIISYSLPLMFAGVIYSIVGQIDYFVIGYFRESSDVAFYRVALALAVNALIILKSLTPIFKPTIAQAQDDTPRLSHHFKLVTRWVTMLTLPIVATFLVAPETYLSIFFTPEYAVASAAFVALSVGYLLNASFGPEGMMLEGLGYTRLTLVNTVILIATNAALDVLLVPRIGILGAGIATGAGLTVAGLAGILEVYYFRGVHPYSISWIKQWIGIVPAALAGIFVASLNMPRILIAIATPIVIVSNFLVALLLVGGFTDDDLRVGKKIDESIGYRIVEPIILLGT